MEGTPWRTGLFVLLATRAGPAAAERLHDTEVRRLTGYANGVEGSEGKFPQMVAGP